MLESKTIFSSTIKNTGRAIELAKGLVSAPHWSSFYVQVGFSNTTE
jgi:hypothetical protein